MMERQHPVWTSTLEVFLLSPNRRPEEDGVTIPSYGPGALDELDDAERQRAAAFRRPADRDLYVAAHIALRRVLATYVGIPARKLTFARADCPRCGGPHGRPVLAEPGPLRSLSHSHGTALIAVAARPVGADVEQLPTMQAGGGACPPCIHTNRRNCDLEEDRRAAFARIWARKEAYLKGTGAGIGRWMSEVYVGDGGPGAPRGPDGWTVRDVPCPAGHAAAVALHGTPPTHTVVRELPGDLRSLTSH